MDLSEFCMSTYTQMCESVSCALLEILNADFLKDFQWEKMSKATASKGKCVFLWKSLDYTGIFY